MAAMYTENAHGKEKTNIQSDMHNAYECCNM